MLGRSLKNVGWSLTMGLLLFCGAASGQNTSSDAQIRARADALLAKMTPAEKAGQLVKINGLAVNGPGLDADIRAGRIGSLA